ncbi:MAG: hypothetical protein K1X75_13285 [Leptospirales bacterium]|nr:hypothetical protein [Leptospirales bacterium]
MSIKGLEGLSDERIHYELQKGAKFVLYEYAISVIVMSFKNPSKLHFIKAGESRVVPGLIYTLISLLFGWWGFPWGPIYTIGSLIVNLTGGKDVTPEVLENLQKMAAADAQPQPT